MSRIGSSAEYDVAFQRFRELWPKMQAHDAGRNVVPVGSPDSDEFEELATALHAFEREEEHQAGFECSPERLQALLRGTREAGAR